MRAIMLMFDTLNKHFLSPYGCEWIKTPNFDRLMKKTVAFDRCYAGSLPCMPARRDLQTGRLNFLHRSWGPIEPYDDCFPEILKKNGIYTHLISDHYHYWEDGGATYHNRYSSWEIVRGQEADPWKGMVGNPYMDESTLGHIREDAVPTGELSAVTLKETETLSTGPAGPNDYMWKPNWVNRHYIQNDAQQPQTICMDLAEDFIRTNSTEDNWFLQVELFDPHEPYYVDKKFTDLYKDDYDGPRFDWPPYTRSDPYTDAQIRHLRNQYAALISKCDESLGRLLDQMDQYALWEDTLLIVNTDHGFLLGEHGWLAKNAPPVYNEICNTPLFIWDPRSKNTGIHSEKLVQTIDLAPTLLNYFGMAVPDSVLGKDIKTILEEPDGAIHEYALFGYHSGHINITDGRYVYMLATADTNDSELYNYTLMPTHVNSFFSEAELQTVELAEPFDFTKGLKLMRVKAPGIVKGIKRIPLETMLFDLAEDPQQNHPYRDESIELRLKKAIKALMAENNAPTELYQRFGL